MEVRQYRYLNRETNTGLDFDGLMADMEAAPNGSVFLLHAGPSARKVSHADNLNSTRF